MVVFDASFAISLFIVDSRSVQARPLVQRLHEEGHTFLAPALWIYEVTSTLQKLRHFGHINTSEIEFALNAMVNFRIELVNADRLLINRAVAWSQQLQKASAYDSFYLALADDRGCELWMADKKLANATKESWVRLLG